MAVDIIKDDQLKLGNLNIFTEEQLKKLQEYNISTAEQFVGSCATPEGFKGLVNLLSINKTELNILLIQVKNKLPAELAELLSKPVTTIPPLGARNPKKLRKKGM